MQGPGILVAASTAKDKNEAAKADFFNVAKSYNAPVFDTGKGLAFLTAGWLVQFYPAV